MSFGWIVERFGIVALCLFSLILLFESIVVYVVCPDQEVLGLILD